MAKQPRTARKRLRQLATRLRPSRRLLRRNAVSLLLALFASALASSIQVSQSDELNRGGPLYALETSVQDLAIRYRDPSAWLYAEDGRPLPDPRTFITIVAMDDKSIEELGVFRSWPRTYHAQVVDNLTAGDSPRAIVFDILFSEPAPEDTELAAAFQRARQRRAQAPAGTAIVIGAAGLSSGRGVGDRGPDGDLAYTTGYLPVPALISAADVAAANVVPDELGAVRNMPLLVRIGDTQYPTLALAGVSKYQRQPRLQFERPDPETLSFVGRQVPVDRSGLMRINYFGPPSDSEGGVQTFRTVSFVDVLKGRADPSLWRNSLVFVGLHNALAFADDYWTPVSTQGRKMYGVEIHANAAATLFSTQFQRELPLWMRVALVVGLAMLVGFLCTNLGVLLGAAGALAIISLYVAGNWLALIATGWQYPMANPVFAALLAFISITGYRVVVEQRQARALQGALASVIPPSVAQEIARDPERVRMGGERREISVLFTDLKGFTTFSESVDPQVLSRVITEYLEAMTAVVFRHGGTVDKFIGDAVMAFWNAPLDDPQHAQHACEAALDMQAALDAINERWIQAGLPRQYMRIGINTGPASVGNMGTQQRFAYTALGDTVNLGARLEPLNTEYGTWICLSQATLDEAGGRDRYLVRFLDLVTVKGKTEPAPVFELIGRSSETELVDRYRPVLEPYHQAMVLYQGRQFGQALDLFRQALTAGPNGPDAPSAVYVERCADLEQEPPVPEWDGVYVMKHK